MRITHAAWKCEICNHKWLAFNSTPPEKCASSKCKSRRWHTVDSRQPLRSEPETGQGGDLPEKAYQGITSPLNSQPVPTVRDEFSENNIEYGEIEGYA